jgi:hypothetical protein
MSNGSFKYKFENLKQYSLEFSNKNSNIEIDNDEINLLPWDAFIFVK